MQKKKKKQKKNLRERNNIFCVEKLCIEWERELQIYSKRWGIRKTKNKRR